MYLPIPTSLLILFLCVAALAPLGSGWPGWWMPYYGALLVCWVLMMIAAMRRVAREDRQSVQRLLQDANNDDELEAQAEAVRLYDIAPLLLRQGWADVTIARS